MRIPLSEFQPKAFKLLEEMRLVLKTEEDRLKNKNCTNEELEVIIKPCRVVMNRTRRKVMKRLEQYNPELKN